MERMTYGWLLKSMLFPFHLICFGTEKVSSKQKSGVFEGCQELLVGTWVDGGIKMNKEEGAQ